MLLSHQRHSDLAQEHKTKLIPSGGANNKSLNFAPPAGSQIEPASRLLITRVETATHMREAVRERSIEISTLFVQTPIQSLTATDKVRCSSSL